MFIELWESCYVFKTVFSMIKSFSLAISGQWLSIYWQEIFMTFKVNKTVVGNSMLSIFFLMVFLVSPRSNFTLSNPLFYSFSWFRLLHFTIHKWASCIKASNSYLIEVGTISVCDLNTMPSAIEISSLQFHHRSNTVLIACY